MKWSGLVGVARIPAVPKLFYIVSPDPLFKGQEPQDQQPDTVFILVKLCIKVPSREFDWMTFTAYVSVISQPYPIEIITT